MPDKSNVQVHIAVVVLMLAVALAGCVGGSGGATSNDDPGPETEIDDPPNASEVENKTKNSTVKVRRGADLDPNSTYHTHDSWGTRSEMTILDPGRDDDATQAADYQGFYNACIPFCSNPTLVFDIPQRREGNDLIANTVFQGTGQIEITLSWSGEAHVGSPTLCVANDGSPIPCGDPATSFTFEESGETKTIDYEEDGILSKETWDAPHARKSDWRFGVQPCEANVVTCIPALQQTEFTLEVTIHRGDTNLPLDPPHFSFYGVKDKLTILNGYPVDDGRVITADDWWYQQRSSDAAGPIWIIERSQIADAGSEHQVVAPGTDEMRVRLEWSEGANDPMETPLELKYIAASDPWGGWQDPSDPSECDGNLTHCLEHTIAVGGLQADSLYALETQWQWGIFMTSDGGPEGMTDGEVQITVEIFKEVQG